MAKDLREFIEFLEERHPQEIIRIKELVSPVFELAGIRSKLEKTGQDAAVIFENVNLCVVDMRSDSLGFLRAVWNGLQRF